MIWQSKMNKITYGRQTINQDDIDEVIKAFLEKQIIDSESKDSDFYVLKEQDLKDLELNNIQMESGMYYIVDYKTNDIITTKGYTATDGQTYYKLTDIEKLEN